MEEALGGQPILRRRKGYSHDLRKRIKAVEAVQIYSLLQEHVHFSSGPVAPGKESRSHKGKQL